MTAKFLKSPGLFSVFWPISVKLFKSSNPSTNPLGIIQCAPVTIGITATLMSQRFFSSLIRSWYLFLFLLSFNFTV